MSGHPEIFRGVPVARRGNRESCHFSCQNGRRAGADRSAGLAGSGYSPRAGSRIHSTIKVELNVDTIETIKAKHAGDATKVINLIKTIERSAEENSGDPFLIALAERARAVQENFENRQTTTADALAELLAELERNEQRKQEQIARGIDNLTYFVLCKLTDAGIAHSDLVSRNIAAAFSNYPNWKRSEHALRELRKKVTFAIIAEEDDMNKVSALVEELFNLLNRTFKA